MVLVHKDTDSERNGFPSYCVLRALRRVLNGDEHNEYTK
jgi:hypothetical protein